MDTTSINPETANYFDGPGLYAWLKDVDGLENLEDRLGNLTRRVNGWKSGEMAKFKTVDMVITKLDSNADIHLIPDEICREGLQSAA